MDSWAGDSQDPLSLHKYLYAHANPVMNTDPSGQFTDTLLTVGMGALGYAAQGAAMAAPMMQALAVSSAVTYMSASLMMGMMDAGWVSNEGRDRMVQLQTYAYWGMVIGTAGYGLSVGVVAAATAMRATIASFGGFIGFSGYGAHANAAYAAARGWSSSLINSVINNPLMIGRTVNGANGNPATAYFMSPNQYVVIDDITGLVVQASNLIKSNWIVDSRIIIVR